MLITNSTTYMYFWVLRLKTRGRVTILTHFLTKHRLVTKEKESTNRYYLMTSIWSNKSPLCIWPNERSEIL